MRSFNLKIVTPDGVHYEGPAEGITLRTVVGDATIWAGHIDLVTALDIGKATVALSETERRLAAASGGVLSVIGDNVTVLASTFEWREDIDLERAAASLEKGKRDLANANDKKEEELAKLRIKRALIRQEVKAEREKI